ncbi:MAG TPA: gamma-glutamyl-gamma-aminobutyrate hydrolase family protein [Dermatophilaceae bacterium]|nr:gamma-glutamyl-gamma-aminobutyrate hydrolase family protein [Dermatophilaceae bacterium]
MAERPLVAIPARFAAHASVLRYGAEVTAAKLVAAVYAAGGEPVTVHPSAPGAVVDDALLAEVAARLGFADAVLLPGGGDLAARWFGQQDHPSVYDVHEEQDAFDLAVAQVALAQRVPLLAICRGVQVVNVALGGDLVQDMADVFGFEHRRRVHELSLDADSPLAEVLGGGRATISCYHHQCLGRLGAGLVTAAHAEDGTIESVTLPQRGAWFLGTQWHPEDSAADDPVQARVFSAFVEAAR